LQYLKPLSLTGVADMIITLVFPSLSGCTISLVGYMSNLLWCNFIIAHE